MPPYIRLSDHYWDLPMGKVSTKNTYEDFKINEKPTNHYEDFSPFLKT